MGFLANKSYPCGKVVQGDYKDAYVYIWDEDTLSLFREKELVFGKFVSEETHRKALNRALITNICSHTVENYEVLSQNQSSEDAGDVLGATLLFGVVGTIAASRQITRTSYLVSVEFQSGEKSIIRLNETGYEIFISSMNMKTHTSNTKRDNKYRLGNEYQEQAIILSKQKQKEIESKEQEQAIILCKERNSQKQKEIKSKESEAIYFAKKSAKCVIKFESVGIPSSKIKCIKAIQTSIKCDEASARRYIDETPSFIVCEKEKASNLLKYFLDLGCQANLLDIENDETQTISNSASEISCKSPNEEVSNNIELIKKFKELLDSGIITQEEFDAKKKQLLGL